MLLFLRELLITLRFALYIWPIVLMFIAAAGFQGMVIAFKAGLDPCMGLKLGAAVGGFGSLAFSWILSQTIPSS